MKLVQVYSPDGESFEVQPHVARNLLKNKDWRTQKEKKPFFKKEAPKAKKADDDSDATDE